MKKFVNLLVFLLVASVAWSAAPSFEQRLQSVESSLRTALALPTGPATQFVHFYIPGEGYFLVLTTDFEMSARSARTPFGNSQPTGSGTVPPRAKVIPVMKQALARFRQAPFPYPFRKGERVHLILIHRNLFRNPFTTSAKPVAFKVWVPLSALQQSSDPLSDMRTD